MVATVVTPVVEVEEHGIRFLLKDETRQITRAFKVRGNAYKLSRLTARTAVTASTGNHGLGLATAAKAHGVHARIYVPESTPAVKREAIAAAGAEVTCVRGGYDDAHAAALTEARRVGAAYVPSFDDPDIVAGHRTLFAELHRQAGRPTVTYVPVGGGGLLAAALTAEAPRSPVVGVELASAPALRDSLVRGRRVTLEQVDPRGAEGLAVARVGALPWTLAVAHRPRVTLVERPEIEAAQRWLWQRAAIRAEGAGAAAVAGVLHDLQHDPAAIPPGADVACVVSGGNVDPVEWARIVSVPSGAGERVA